MKIQETLDNFPFMTFRALGILYILLGVLAMAAGVFDVIWTVINYTDQYDNCDAETTSDFLAAQLEDPCDHDELRWTWAASGAWGGLLILLVGVVGVMFSPWRTKRLKFQRDMFTITNALLVVPVCPAILAISILQLVYQDDIFYRTGDDDSLEVEDYGKLVAPLIVVGLTFLAWCLAIAGASIGCCCASIDGGVAPPVYAQQPVAAMQPVVQQPEQYEVVAVPQPAPPPYYVIGPPPPGFFRPPGPPPPFMRPPPPRFPALMPPPGLARY